MLFNSLTFILFFAVVLILHYVLPHKLRWIMLLSASCIFYMAWRAELIVLILFSSLVNYYLSIKINSSDKYKYRKCLLIISLIINFGFLFIFKYMVFINHTFMSLYNFFGWRYPLNDFSIILPMGISFYTFQAASYTIDIYNKKYKPEKNYFKLTLFITFFPQLVAGPIERADNLLPQIFKYKKFDINNITEGIKIMSFGFFKKVVIADRAAILVNTVYNSPKEYTGISFIIATFLFAFQIYCDFSGYSDIAIGCAKTLGIDLMQNFNKPYFSRSIKEFWRRWHISLSTWFRDYLYIPLGGSRVSEGRHYFNIFITFMASGLWHGAEWTFVIWGILHGVYQIFGDIKNQVFKFKLDNFVFNFFRIIITFILVLFAWIFFRANSLADAFYIIRNLFSDYTNWTNLQYIYDILNNLGLQMYEIKFLILMIALLIFTEIISFKNSIHLFLNKCPFIFRFGFYYLIVVLIFALGVFDSAGEFIYFQF